MIDDASSPAGSVPHAYRNALFWEWAGAMPRQLAGGFVTVLYALAAAAEPSGRVRFRRDGKPLRITDIARAAKVREQNCRLYLNAAIAAGVLVAEGGTRRGRRNLYTLILSPCPDWAAAVRVVKQVQEPTEFGLQEPEPDDEEFGLQRTELEPDPADKVRATEDRTSSGYRSPNGSGYRSPNNPGSTQEISHEMAEVVALPQPPRGLAEFRATRDSLRRDQR